MWVNLKHIEDPTLERIAKVLGVSANAIKNFNEDLAVNYINTFNDNSINQGANYQPTYNINPVEKWLETLDENKKLYEALLKEKDEKIALLQKVLEGKK